MCIRDSQGAGPYFYVDDFQLERGEGPSGVNLVENGGMRYWDYGWVMEKFSTFDKTVTMFTKEDDHSIRVCLLYTSFPPGREGVAVCLPGDSAPEAWERGEEHPGSLRLRTEREYGVL